MNIAERVFHAAQKLSRELEIIPGIPLPPAVVGADPTDYCADYFRAYLDRAASGQRPCLIVGMNPSPHGQAQNGVPFGDTPIVRRILADYSLRRARQDQPPRPSIARPNTTWGTSINVPLHEAIGLEYPRGEESGRRLWGLLEQLCGSLDAVLERCLLINYCPLVLLDAAGRNVTPSSWPRTAEPVRTMEAACDAWIREVVSIVKPETVIGVGAYAHDRCGWALREVVGLQVVGMRHPSPLAGSAQAWQSIALPILARALGVDIT